MPFGCFQLADPLGEVPGQQCARSHSVSDVSDSLTAPLLGCLAWPQAVAADVLTSDTYLVDVSDISNIFSARGRRRESPGRQGGGGGRFFIDIQGGGGGSLKGGGGARGPGGGLRRI